MKATITNVIKEGMGLRVFADFKDEERSYLFGADVVSEEIIERIKKDVEELGSLETKVEKTRKELTGTVISSKDER